MPNDTPQAVFTADQLVSYYLQCRAKAEEIEAEAKAKLKPVHDAMVMIETTLMGHLQAQGMQNFSTAEGTAYLSTLTSAKVVDWDVFYRFCIEQGGTGLMTHGANKKAVEEYIEANGAAPPGLDVSRITRCNIRKA